MDASRRHDEDSSAPERSRPPASPLPVFREVALHAADWGNGPALLFSLAPDGAAKLRAAARLASAGAARAAAAALLEAVRETIQAGEARTVPAPPELPGAQAGVRILPLSGSTGPFGALVLGLRPPPDAERQRVLDLVADAAAARLELWSVRGELRELQQRFQDSRSLAEKKNDEVLRLSEELFAQDIELLRHNEKLGKVEKLKNDFIEKMSRELRTPLNSIIESIIAVLAGENDVLSESGKLSLRSALDDGTAFLRTLQNILDLWKIRQGELPVELQDVNFREVVEEAIFSIQDTLGNKPIVIEKRFEEPFPKFRTDLAKINQILFLLLDNAAKFTPQGKIEIEARVADGQLHCEVRDTGIGICPDDQQFVFDEFYQVDDLASTKYRGAGLGLALVRDLLVLLEGEVSLASEAGKGSRFSFSLPVQVID